MRTTLSLLPLTLATVATLATAGCGNAVDPTGTGGTAQNPLVGTWLSQGADVAPLLAGAPFNNVSITATFNADGSYTVDGIDTSNKDTMYAGAYVTTASSVAGVVDITLMQTAPSTATAQGIFSIDATVTPPRMQYEVVQTQPTNGLVPPTAEKGFGSTIYNGQPISTLIQKYSRQ
jgi:hypothetical protein